MKIDIPHYGELDIQNIVFDYNGTLASGGRVSPQTRKLLKEVTALYDVYVITADTFGTVKAELEAFDLQVTVLGSQDHTAEKAAFVEKLGKAHTVALGNGNNDQAMLKGAVVSIAIIGGEGCAVESMLAADIVCHGIMDAMRLLIESGRMKATLRR